VFKVKVLSLLQIRNQEKKEKMKNLNQHRNLANKLTNEYGYKGIKAIQDQTTGEALILMTNNADAEEMFEIFGAEGFAFGSRN
jgi:hypothetical protein